MSSAQRRKALKERIARGEYRPRRFVSHFTRGMVVNELLSRAIKVDATIFSTKKVPSLDHDDSHIHVFAPKNPHQRASRSARTTEILFEPAHLGREHLDAAAEPAKVVSPDRDQIRLASAVRLLAAAFAF